MNPFLRSALRYSSFLALVLLLGGCEQGVDVEDTPEQSAQEALGIEDTDATSRTIEQERDVIVRDTTKVLDADTGEVITTEQTETPVSIIQEKTIERDVNVDAGETETTVE